MLSGNDVLTASSCALTCDTYKHIDFQFVFSSIQAKNQSMTKPKNSQNRSAINNIQNHERFFMFFLMPFLLFPPMCWFRFGQICGWDFVTCGSFVTLCKQFPVCWHLVGRLCGDQWQPLAKWSMSVMKVIWVWSLTNCSSSICLLIAPSSRFVLVRGYLWLLKIPFQTWQWSASRKLH